MVGCVKGWASVSYTPLTAPLDSGLRRNDESGGRRSWEAGLASDAMEALPHSSPPLWIPAFAGMTNRGAGALGKVGWPPMHRGTALPHSSPPLWIPAFAGMTKCGAGMTKWGAGMTMVGGRNDESGGRRSWEGRLGLRCTEEGLASHSSPPLWIPAFAGMTKWGGRQ